MPEHVGRKLAAILVSDVVGYSRLAGADEELTLARLRALRSDLIDPIVSVHHGRIVKRTGDGALVEFRSVVDAVRCAIETQTGLVERNAGLPPERRIEFRIGIHLGDVMEEADGDLMGDGVNIAARLETMCEPGGVCLSEDAYRQVRSRLDLSVTDLGDQALKNIAEPMRVYALTVGKPATARPATPRGTPQNKSATPAKAGVHRADVATATTMDPGFRRGEVKNLVPIIAGVAALIVIAAVASWYFLARPGANLATNAPAHLSIVVLPFANLSNDPKQDYFADGITENLTTDLSRIRNSFVIARNTAFTYKGKNVDAKEIGKELGVRYVLEGSVQRDGNRVRVNAQLIDAESGSHLWANRFEDDLADLFKLQDDVVARLANALGYELVNAEAARGARAANPDAIDLTMQGLALLRQTTKDNNKAARVLFERALSKDPTDSDALAGMAETYERSRAYGWDNSPVDYDAKVIGFADRSIALNPANALAYVAKAVYLSHTKRPAEALATAETGLEHTPNIATLYFARAISEMSLARYDQSRSDLLQAIRLSPRDPQLYLDNTLLAGTELLLGHDEATILYARKAIEEGFRGWYVYAYLAASSAFLGKDVEAATAIADARRVNPSLTVKWAMAHSADGPRFFEGLRKAGLPEDEPPKHLSIVVLPFTNLSGDPKQDYFADGITDNLTTDLSRIRNSFVIARNTAFTYKGKSVDAREIGKELGVRYVLEGSVQRDGNRVRVNAQLVDAESGAHLWADRFEEDLADLFKLQDDVVARLANTLGYELVKAEAAKSAHSTNPDAIDLTMRGLALFWQQPKKETNLSARNYFEQALKLDPNSPDALAGISATYMREFVYAWDASTSSYDAKIVGVADRTTALDPTNVLAHYAKAMYLANNGHPEDALAAANAGLTADPNFAPLYFARSLAGMALDQFNQARSDISRAIRLSPRDAQIGDWHNFLGAVEIQLGHDDAAIEDEKKAIEEGYRVWFPYARLAAAYALQGKDEEAKSALAEARGINPKLTIKWAMKHSTNGPRFFEGLRKAGLPEDEGPRLSIVVLPFQNLSGDAKQDYLADVLTDELTTYISRIPGSFVIARNTAFTYKGKPTGVKTIGKDLGVRYALEGSVQPTDKRIRTNAQLIDTETGAHLWAEQFDTDKTDLLQTEDEIVTRLARTLQLQLTEIEAARLGQMHPANSEAQELALRCDAMVSGSGSLYGGKDADAGYALCEKALEIDPKNVVALAFLSIKFGSRVQEYMSVDRDADLARSEEFATRALAIDPNNAYAFVGRAFALVAKGRFEEAGITAEHALALAPSLIEAYNLQTLIDLYTGDAEKVIESADKAMRLSPRDPLLFNLIALKGTAYFMRREDAKAIELFRRANALNPSPTPNYFYLTAAQALSGQEAEARETLKRYLAIPSVRTRSIAAWKARTYSTNPTYLAMRERVYEGLRKAGMPEQ